MSTLELLQLQNEHKDNFFGKGEDSTYDYDLIKVAEEKIITGYDILSNEVKKVQKEYEDRKGWKPSEFIVVFDLKYEWEKSYEHMVEFCTIYEIGTEWNMDWWEGQTDIVVKKVVALRDLYDILLTK